MSDHIELIFNVEYWKKVYLQGGDLERYREVKDDEKALADFLLPYFIGDWGGIEVSEFKGDGSGHWYEDIFDGAVRLEADGS